MKKITLLFCVFWFTMNMNAQIFEDFETDPPPGWTFMHTESDDPGFVQTNARANTGTYSFYKNDDNIAVESTAWMISPAHTVSAGDELSLYYNHNYTTIGYGVENGVWISTTSADPIANPGDFALLYDLLGNASEDAWTLYNQNLDAYAGETIYVAIKYVGDFEDELYIDDFSLAPPPTCPVPANVTTTPLDESADLFWDSVAEASMGYEWVVLDTNGDPDTDTAIDSGSTASGVTMDTATGLTTSTTYYAFVRANCDSGGFSNWSPSTSFTTLAGPPPANDLCDNAIAITCGTPITGQSTEAATGGTATSCVGTIGDDIWFQLTGNDMDVVLTVTASVEEAQVEVYESTDGTCAGITPGTCFAAGGSGENPVEVSFTALVGNEYYIRVGNWINGDPGVVFDIEAACTPIQPAPDCAMEPITPANGETGVEAFDPITLSWTAPASGPTPTSYDIYVGTMMDGSDQAFFANTTDTFFDAPVGAYDTTIYWTVIPLNATSPATGCPLWSFTSESAPPPPGNDDCAGAIPLTPGTVFTDNVIVGNNESATDSEVGDPTIPAPGCSSYLGGDIWYSVVVPADGNLDIETNGNPTGSAGDTGMAVYSGACGSLVLVDCDDDGSDDGLYSLISISDTNLAGQTLYIRVFEYGNNAVVSFQISAYSATLSVDKFENQSLFTYYPNPVTSNLTLNAQSNIQNVTVFNMLGQQVMRTAPNAVNSEVDMTTLNPGAYFVQVTVNDTVETIRVIKN